MVWWTFWICFANLRMTCSGSGVLGGGGGTATLSECAVYRWWREMVEGSRVVVEKISI